MYADAMVPIGCWPLTAYSAHWTPGEISQVSNLSIFLLVFAKGSPRKSAFLYDDSRCLELCPCACRCLTWAFLAHSALFFSFLGHVALSCDDRNMLVVLRAGNKIHHLAAAAQRQVDSGIQRLAAPVRPLLGGGPQGQVDAGGRERKHVQPPAQWRSVKAGADAGSVLRGGGGG